MRRLRCLLGHATATPRIVSSEHGLYVILRCTRCPARRTLPADYAGTNPILPQSVR